MKKIAIAKGKYFAIVDDEDFEYLNQCKWNITHHGYARGGCKYFSGMMHRIINETPDGFDTDHINGNRLDNRRVNLRTVSRSENMFNMHREYVGKILNISDEEFMEKARCRPRGNRYIHRVERRN